MTFVFRHQLGEIRIWLEPDAPYGMLWGPHPGKPGGVELWGFERGNSKAKDIAEIATSEALRLLRSPEPGKDSDIGALLKLATLVWEKPVCWPFPPYEYPPGTKHEH